MHLPDFFIYQLAPTSFYRYTLKVHITQLLIKEMSVLDFVTTLVYFLNIGLFSALVARFTGAVLSVLVFCSLLYMGATPIETIGMMLTYLVFMRLTIYTQRNRVNFKKMQVFTGMKIVPAIALILIFLFLYPFAGLAVFLLVFMAEVLSKMRSRMLSEKKMSCKELMPYIIAGSVLMTLSMLLVEFIPESFYYILGGFMIFALCAFFWWVGDNRDRLSSSWDKVIIASFIPAGLFGFDMADWIDDLKRNVNPTRLAFNLPFIFLPVFFITFVMANILFGIFSLSGMVVVFCSAIGLRLFGYYEMSGKGKMNRIALGITLLAAFLLFLTAPAPIGVTQSIDAFLNQNHYGFNGILNMF